MQQQYKYVSEFKYIASRANPLIVRVNELKDKKGRTASGLFAIEGEKLLTEVMQSKYALEFVLVTEKAADSYSILEEVQRLAQIYVVADPVYQKLTQEQAPQGILAAVRLPDVYATADAGLPAIILHSVRDPVNVGTILRSALAFGVHTVYLSSDCADIYSGKVFRASMGTLFKLNTVAYADISEVCDRLRQMDCAIYAAALGHNTISLAGVASDKRNVFIFGNEGQGLPDEIIALADSAVKIPIQPDCESLNVAVAAGVILYHNNKL